MRIFDETTLYHVPTEKTLRSTQGENHGQLTREGRANFSLPEKPQKRYEKDRADEPGAAEIDARREAIWEPYHAKLAQELGRLRDRHGVALLWDAHSIRSMLPRFFEGRLPDLNLGTANGASCAPQLAQALLDLAREESECFSSVLNGRFKGGYITRHYGRPDQGAHAVQLEMTQCSYMDEAPPFAYRPEQAARVQPLLGRLLERMLAFAADGRPSLPTAT